MNRPMPSLPSSATETRMVDMVFPDQATHSGVLFGGQALRMMDMSAFITASRYTRRNIVTASSERVDFHIPVRRGQLVELVGRVVSTGRTSLTVEVELFAEELLTGVRELCTRGRFIMVALDENHKPTPVPPLAPEPT